MTRNGFVPRKVCRECPFPARIAFVGSIVWNRAFQVKEDLQSPRGRFVGAYLRRSPNDPRRYFSVAEYQEKLDRLSAKLARLSQLQLRFKFWMPQQTHQVDDADPAEEVNHLNARQR